MRRELAALCLIAAVFLPATAATAASDASWDVRFEGTETVVIPPMGSTTDGSSSESEASRSLSCTVEGCVLFHDAELTVTLPPGATSATASLPGQGDACTGTAAETLTVTVVGETLTTEHVLEPMGPDDCGGSTEVRSSGVISTFTGAWISGDLCVVRGEECATADAPTADAPVAAPATEATPVPADGGSGSFLNTGLPAAPSVLSTLATPATAGTAPQQLALAAVLAVVLVLLVAFPTSLLNSAVETGSERLSAWWARRRPPVATDGRDPARWTRTWWWAAAGVAAASVLSAFVDPQFGFNPGSARVVLSLLVGFAVDVVLGWAVVVWLVRRIVPGVTHSYRFRPLTLLVVVAAVVFTRATGFEPGIVFGLVAGVAFGAIAGRAHQARAALTGAGWAFGLAVVAWLVYGMLAPTTGDSFWSTFVVETLSSIAIGGMAALPIALIPLRGLGGFPIWAWRRQVWAACYLVGLFAFFVVLMPMPFSWAEVSLTLGAWIGIYLAYAAAAVTAWLMLSRPWRKEPQSGEMEGAAASGTADRVGE